jgi:succinoglycan biosynthesis protein ExoO
VKLLRVSIIIAAWNAEATIERCIASALQQRGVDPEILVINDCSTDRTVDVVANIARAHPKVKLLSTPQNGGPSAARNIGLANASGEWIAVLDADDAMAPERLSAMTGFATEQGLDICFDNLRMRANDAAVSRNGQNFLPEKLARELGRPWTLESYCGLNQPYKSERLLGFLKPLISARYVAAHGLRYTEAVRVGEDYLLICEALMHGARAALLNKPFYDYYVVDASLSGDYRRDANDALISAERRLLEKWRLHLTSPQARAIEAHIHSVILAGETNAVFQALRARKFDKAFYEIVSTRHAPLHAKRVLRAALRKVSRESTRGR